MGSDVTRPLSLIETEINFYKAQTANGMIEIGKRLLEAKEQVPHGEWGKWLEDKVDFSQETARRFMRIAEEFSNSSAGRNLSERKLFLLLDVPQEQREDFVDKHQLEDMTTRQVEAAVKEWKAKAEKAEQDLQKANQVIQDKKDDIKFLQEEMQDDKDRNDAKIQKLTEQLEAMKARGDNSKDIEKLEEDLKEAKRQVEILTDQLMTPVQLEPAVVEKIVEKIPEETEKELNELRQKIGQQVDPATVKFRVQFDGIVKGFRELLETLGDISDMELNKKYKKAVVGLMDKMLGELQ